jgi:hypothetical protein
MSRAGALLLPLLALPACADAPSPARAPGALVSEAEQSGFARTGRYAEVERLCLGFEQAYPGRVRCVQFGTTPEHRPMLALVASADGVLDPEAARAKRRPVVLFQGGIHAGEIDGKDGGFWALREMLDGTSAAGALAAVTAVFIPVLNPDGHERFGPNHRPNQRGPEQMGFRTTAQNLNLNRDYAKAEAPEMGALLALFEAWDPVVYVDLHTTDGAQFQHDVAVLVEPTLPGKDPLTAAAVWLSGAVQGRLAQLGHLPLPFYPSFAKTDDPTSGFSTEPAPPRFSQAYAAARGRVGVLVETHSWGTYRQRVRTVRDALAALFEHLPAGAGALRAAADAADLAGARLGGTEVALTYQPTARSHLVDFRGYAYEKRPSEISGGPWITYDEARPEVWRVPLFDEIVPLLTVRAPRAGYVVPAAFAGVVAAKLRLHGLRYQVLPAARAAFPVEVFRADEVSFGKPYEARTPAHVKGAWQAARADLPVGSIFVPIAQPRGRLVLHLLEPMAPDSLVSWGFFNAVFEQKEYLEAYVAEAEARRMLAADPALRAAFEQRLADPAFAASPEARLEFFYRRHPSWDERKDVVPVLRVAEAPVAGG